MTGRLPPSERTTVTDSTPHDGFTPTDPDRLDGSRADESAPSETTGARRQGTGDRAADADDTFTHDTGAVDAGSRGASLPAAAHANAHTGSRPVVDGRDARPNYGVGPFSVREVALLGIWVVAFLVSFFRTNILESGSSVLIGGANVWLSGLWWIPAIALPTVAVGLVVLRRLSPQGIRRVGSLGIDQFASVAFTISALVWVSWVWDAVAVYASNTVWTRSWVIWVEAVLLLAGVVLTVFAPFIPPFSADFRDREEIPAHRNARPIRPVVARPRTPRTPSTPGSARAAAAHSSAHVDADAPTPGTYTGSTDLAHDPAPATSVLPLTPTPTTPTSSRRCAPMTIVTTRTVTTTTRAGLPRPATSPRPSSVPRTTTTRTRRRSGRWLPRSARSSTTTARRSSGSGRRRGRS